MISLNQLGVIPALLIILASMTILHGKDKEKTVWRPSTRSSVLTQSGEYAFQAASEISKGCLMSIFRAVHPKSGLHWVGGNVIL